MNAQWVDGNDAEVGELKAGYRKREGKVQEI